jgi:group I intron endonuclease
MVSGIYKIINQINGDFYVGSSKNLFRRRDEHFRKLRLKKHQNVILQRAWDKYGESNFIFEIVEECDVDLLMEKENLYLGQSPKYNIVKVAKGGDTISNNPKRELIIEKISKRSSGVNNPNYGGKFKNDEWIHKQKISNSKVHLKIIDTITGEVYEFYNSKDAAKYFNCSSSTIRENKKNNWLLKRRFKIVNKN